MKKEKLIKSIEDSYEKAKSMTEFKNEVLRLINLYDKKTKQKKEFVTGPR